jgi:hypothetical protein
MTWCRSSLRQRPLALSSNPKPDGVPMAGCTAIVTRFPTARSACWLDHHQTLPCPPSPSVLPMRLHFSREQFHFERGDLPPQFVGRDVSARSRFASLSQLRPAVDQLCLEHCSPRRDGLQLLDLLRLVAAGFTFKMQSVHSIESHAARSLAHGLQMMRHIHPQF